MRHELALSASSIDHAIMRFVFFAAIFGCALATPATAAPIARGEMREPKAVVAYKLAATLDPIAHTVKGEGTLTWTNTSNVAVSELWFHLYLNGFKPGSLFYKEATNEGGRGTKLSGSAGSIALVKLQIDEPNGQDLLPTLQARGNAVGALEDETDAKVTLSHPIAAGTSIRLALKWTSILPEIVERTGYKDSFHLVGQWFPKIARLEKDGTWAHFPFHHLAEFYADFGSYEVTITAPAAFAIGATGEKTNEQANNGQHAVTYTQDRVHDFAWTAWDKFQERSERIHDVDVRLLYPPGYDGAATRSSNAMRTAFPSFAQRVGPYPYRVLTIVHPPVGAEEAGGMEYPTLITTGGSWFNNPLVHDVEGVTIHEFGHQYFYGLLASNEERYPFLDEGLNTYLEGLVASDLFGRASLLGKIGPYEPDAATLNAVYSRDRARDHAIGQPAYSFRSGRAYGSLVYARTRALLDTLSRTYGPCVNDGIQLYFREWHFRHPTPQDFFDAVTRTCGTSAADALAAGIDNRGSVNVTAISLIDIGGTTELEASNRGTLRLPIDIEFWMTDGTKQLRTHVPMSDGAFTVSVSGAATHAVIDPDHKLLIDVDWQDQHAIAKDVTPVGSPTTFERATYWLSEIVLGGGP